MDQSSADTSNLNESLDQMTGEAEGLAKKAGEVAESQYAAALKKAGEQLRRAQAEFMRLEEAALERTRAAARVTDDAVHEYPYAAMGAAAALGVVIGMLIARR